MDDKEYLSIKYRIHLKNNENSLLSSSTILSNQRQRSFRTKSTNYDSLKNVTSDQNIDKQHREQLKYETPSSSQQSRKSAINRTAKSGTNLNYPAMTSSKSSQTDYFKDIDPCTNCNNLLTRATEFLAKIELNYGLSTKSPSSLSTFSQYPTTSTTASSIKQSSKKMGQYDDRRKESNNSDLSTSTFDNKVIPIRSSSKAKLIKHKL
ncbi:hypothetical protein QQG55_18750 [Brugia pahangi]